MPGSIYSRYALIRYNLPKGRFRYALILISLSVCQGANAHILLEYLMEVICVIESDLIRNLCDSLIGADQQLHRVIYLDSVDISDRSFSDTVAEHFSEVIGRNHNYRAKILYIYFLGVMLRYVVYNGAKAQNVVILKPLRIVLLAAVVAQKLCH